MNDTKELVNLLNDLEKALETLVQGKAMEVTDLMSEALPYLSEASKLVLNKKVNTLTVTENEETYTAIYLGVTCKASNLNEGIKIIADSVNILSEKGLIHSTLSPISSLALAIFPSQAPSLAVTCCVLVPEKRKKEAENLVKSCIFYESGCLPEAHSLYKELPEGQFYSNITISCYFIEQLGINSDEAAQKEVEKMLKILPEGTSLVSLTQCAIIGLSVPYEVIFYNPLLPSIKEVEFEYIRHCERVGEEFKEMNLLVGVIYNTRDGRKMPTRI